MLFRLTVIVLAGAVLSACAAFTTPPTRADIPLTRIAFGSCADQNRPQPIWDAVLGYRPQTFLFLGDNVYGDVTSPDMAELKTAYEKARAIPAMTQLRAEADVLATWDDHDYGRNDAGATFPYREQAKELFLDHWQVPPGDKRRNRAGIYFSRIQGPPGKRVQIIMLDTRSFRSDLIPTGKRRPKYMPDPDPAKTVLGAAQWAWLRAELRKPADLRLLVSSIQVVADDHGWERWGNLPAERQRLFDTIRDTGAKGVVLLSGDRHFGALYALKAGVPYPLYELTSSSLNRPWRNADERGPRQIVAAYGPENFGTVDIDWARRTVLLALRDIKGRIVRRQTIRLDNPGS